MQEIVCLLWGIGWLVGPVLMYGFEVLASPHRGCPESG